MTIPAYYEMDTDSFLQGSRLELVKFPSADAVYKAMADVMCECIIANNKKQLPSVIIAPAGMYGYCPYFVQRVNAEKIDLRNLWLIYTGEFLDENGAYIDQNSPLSSRGYFLDEVYSRIAPALNIPAEQVVFPDPEEPDLIDHLLTKLGEADLCLTFPGIDGSLSFNQPDASLSLKDFSRQGSRIVSIGDSMKTEIAIHVLGGALECVPSKAVALGMKPLLKARRILLAAVRDSQSAALRRAALGDVSSEFPATFLQAHHQVLALASENALKLPF